MLSELKHTCFKTLKGFCTPYPRTRILSLFCDEKRKNSRQERETRFFNIRNQGFRTFLNGGSGVSPDNSNNSNSVFFFFGSLFLFASQSKRKSEQSANSLELERTCIMKSLPEYKNQLLKEALLYAHNNKISYK